MSAYLGSCWRAMRRACHFDRIHFHNRIFLPFAILLAALGKPVIYDLQEDYRSEALSWKFHPIVNRALSVAFAILKGIGQRMFVSTIAATPRIAQHFGRGLHWPWIIENVRCGLLVDSLDPEAIAQVISFIVSDIHDADALGARG